MINRNFVGVLAVFTALVIFTLFSLMLTTTEASAKEIKINDFPGATHFTEVCKLDDNGNRTRCEFKPVIETRKAPEREWNTNQTAEQVMDEVLAEVNESRAVRDSLKNLMDRANNTDRTANSSTTPTDNRVASASL